MIALLRGEVAVRRADHVVILCGSVGYRAAVSAETLRHVPAVGEQVTLHAHLIVRDDALALYGFHSEQERDLFLMLLSVQAVGPKVALAVLSGGTPRELIAALAAGDAARFQAVPGIGKRTAERIIVELREKVEVTSGAEAAGGADPAASAAGERPRAIRAVLARDGLLELGYAPGEVEELLRDAAGRQRRGADRARAAPGAGVLMTRDERPASRRPTWSPRTSSTARCARGACEDFVGQETLREQLAVAIEAASARGDALDHLLLAGPPGLGKTSLAQIVAAELDVPFVQTAGPALERKGDIAAFLTALEPRSVFFVDEIHRLPRTLEETFYPAMEDHRLPITVGQGAGARVVTLELPPFTLVGRDDAHGPADDAAARPLRHPGAPRAVLGGTSSRSSCAARRASSRSSSRTRARWRSRRAAGARRAWPTGCSSACATSPRCAWRASSRRRPRTRRWRCSRSTSAGSIAWTARSCARSA